MCFFHTSAGGGSFFKFGGFAQQSIWQKWIRHHCNSRTGVGQEFTYLSPQKSHKHVTSARSDCMATLPETLDNKSGLYKLETQQATEPQEAVKEKMMKNDRDAQTPQTSCGQSIFPRTWRVLTVRAFGRMTYDKSLRRGHDRTCVSRGHGTSQKMTSFSRGQFADMDTCTPYVRIQCVMKPKTKKTRIGATIGKCSCVFHCTKVLTKLTFSAARTQDPAKTFGSQVSVSWLVSLPTPCRLEPKKATKNILTHRNGHCGKKHEKTYQNDFKFQFIKKTFDNKKS